MIELMGLTLRAGRIKTTEIGLHWGEIEHTRIKMGRQMDANPDYRQLYLRLLTDPHAIRHYLNLKLAISTDEKLQANTERNIENDFCICTLESTTVVYSYSDG